MSSSYIQEMLLCYIADFLSFQCPSHFLSVFFSDFLDFLNFLDAPEFQEILELKKFLQMQKLSCFRVWNLQTSIWQWMSLSANFVYIVYRCCSRTFYQDLSTCESPDDKTKFLHVKSLLYHFFNFLKPFLLHSYEVKALLQILLRVFVILNRCRRSSH